MYRPQFFYNTIALFLLLISLIFFVPILSEYMKTGLVPKIPTLITCGFAVIAAIQSFFAGMILQTIEQKNKQDFEILLHKAEKDKKELISEKEPGSHASE